MPVPDRLKESAQVYTTNLTVDSALNLIPQDAALLRSGLKCNIHRGGRLAEDAALAIGMNATLAGLGYFENTRQNQADLISGRIIQDSDGDCWVIRGRPSVRSRFGPTKHIKCLLEFLPFKPSGIA